MLPYGASRKRALYQRRRETVHELRRAGTPVALTDVVIAVAAVRAGAVLWSTDQDVERIRHVLPELELHE